MFITERPKALLHAILLLRTRIMGKLSFGIGRLTKGGRKTLGGGLTPAVKFSRQEGMSVFVSHWLELVT